MSLIIPINKKIYDLVIFGIKGDLSRKKILPSLYRLEKFGLIHPKTRIIGVSRSNWNIKKYIDIVRSALETFLMEEINEKFWNNFKIKLDFCIFDIKKIKDFKILKKKLDKKSRIIINYFAIPPNLFEDVCIGLGKNNINKKSSRIVMEKPFGTDLYSSRSINNQIRRFFKEKQIYRIDHYLGKESILNLLVLRFANSLFLSNWNRRFIDHVQITIAEEIGVENRWEYFDKIGQMKDMIQSHLLQILTIIAMSTPTDLSADKIRDEKIKVLQSLRPINHTNIHSNTVRGQYTSGFINGRKVPGYLEEIGATNNSFTETFVSIRVYVDNIQWKGVPFYLRTGKRLPKKISEIAVYFKNSRMNLFHEFYKSLPKNKLVIHLHNGKVSIQILNRKFGLNNDTFNLKKAELNLNVNNNFNKKTGFLSGYERLLLETMRGMKSLFVRKDEIEESWKWVDSIIKAWHVNKNRPELYSAGTWGPKNSINMLTKEGRKWNET